MAIDRWIAKANTDRFVFRDRIPNALTTIPRIAITTPPAGNDTQAATENTVNIHAAQLAAVIVSPHAPPAN